MFVVYISTLNIITIMNVLEIQNFPMDAKVKKYYSGTRIDIPIKIDVIKKHIAYEYFLPSNLKFIRKTQSI